VKYLGWGVFGVMTPVIRWRIRRIVNGCAAQQLVARRDVIALKSFSLV